MIRFFRQTRRARRFLTAVMVLSGASVSAADLTVRINDVRVQAGNLMLSLVDSPAGWDSQAAPVAAQVVAAVGETAEVVFTDLAPGDYAVMVLHDENDNGQLDTNLVGMPIEGYGFSNNPQVMRKPTWDEARFALADDNQRVDIDLR